MHSMRINALNDNLILDLNCGELPHVELDFFSYCHRYINEKRLYLSDNNNQGTVCYSY